MKIKINLFKIQLIIGILGIWLAGIAQAAAPVWTFAPVSGYPATVTVRCTESATIEYTVTNQSPKTHMLKMLPIHGITPSGCTSPLAYHQSCTLRLSVDGSALTGNVNGGPALCDDGNPMFSYQPGDTDALHITWIPPALYTVSPVGDGNEVINPNTPQQVIEGTTRSFTVTANPGYNLLSTVGGTCPQGSWSGNTYTTGVISSNCSVSFSATLTMYTVTPQGDGNETISPNTAQTVLPNATQQFTVTPASGYTLSQTVTGTCPAGLWSGSTYTTGGIIGDCSVMSMFVLNDELYVGTVNGYVLSLINNNDGTWSSDTISTQPDGAGVSSLFMHQGNLSSLFVGAATEIPVNGSQSSVTVINQSNATVTNVQAQLPVSLSAVTQDASACTSLAPQASCILKFTSTQPYAPQNVAIVGANTSEPIYRIGLVFSLNGYYVYYVDSNKAYVVDNSDVTDPASPLSWASNGSTSGFINVSLDRLPGIDETSSSPSNQSPAYSSFATVFDNIYTNTLPPNFSSSFSACNGAYDGQCNTNNILAFYNAYLINYSGLCATSGSCLASAGPTPLSYYPAGLCNQSTNGGASPGSWYLPSLCELTGGVYLNSLTGSIENCAPATTGVISLYSLGFLSSMGASGSYWSSTEYAVQATSYAWFVSFFPGNGTVSYQPNSKVGMESARCAQAIAY